jgi:hypothetical protein
MTESTFRIAGGAVIPTDQIVLPPRTDVTYIEDRALWVDHDNLASRPSDDHYLVWAAVWVPGDVLDAT